MWKRDNEPTPAPTPAAPPVVRVDRHEPEPAPARFADSGGRATIGATLELEGAITGGEDLHIEGRVRGRIDLPEHAVTIGVRGRISASVHARMLAIEGEVDGNLVAEELLVLKKSARVRGDLVAPRVVIEDGARFQGTIDMDPAKPTLAAGTRPAESETPAADDSDGEVR